jgi:hypothetical protein|tara:strand:- start:424 stop:909 length:486 start_codon:yes stop_codon:yes gene_type:complete
MATLTSTITETVTLNGSARGSSNALSITGINDVYHRIVTCPDDVPLSLATFKSTVGVAIAEQLMDIELVKYIRITNMDASNPVILNLLIDTGEDDSAADLGASIELEAGKSFIMGSPHESILVDDDAATVNVSNVALMDLRSIHVDPVSEAVQVEVFIASA